MLVCTPSRMTFLMPRCFEQVPDLDAGVADGVLVVDRAGTSIWLFHGACGLRPIAGEFRCASPRARSGRRPRRRRSGRSDTCPSPRRESACTTRRCPSGRFLACGAAWARLRAGWSLYGSMQLRGAWMMSTPCCARLLQHLVHARGHLLHAAHGVQAVVRVPHVADDDGRLARVPLLGLLPHDICGMRRLLADAHVNRNRGARARLRARAKS